MERIPKERCTLNEREKPWGLFVSLHARSRSLPSHPICLYSSDNFTAGQHRLGFRWIRQSNLLSSLPRHIYLNQSHSEMIACTRTCARIHTHTQTHKQRTSRFISTIIEYADAQRTFDYLVRRRGNWGARQRQVILRKRGEKSEKIEKQKDFAPSINTEIMLNTMLSSL